VNAHAAYALAHPVFDPDRQITQAFFWRDGRLSLGLTVNLGME
jgi:hypothetical protein